MSDRLSPLPDGFGSTAAALHRVAEQLVAPARKPDEEISLRATPGGFGTPVFEFGGTRHQVRVEGAELIHSANGEERRAPLGSLAEAASAIADLLPADAQLDSEPLAIDPEASRALGRLYGLGAEVLGRLVERAGPEEEATAPRLWPEHFDIAVELGSEAAGLRANYGLSPGDEDHPEPYLYVGPWSAAVAGDLWLAQGFKGAELSYAKLLSTSDPEAAALEFLATRRDALNDIDPPSEETT